MNQYIRLVETKPELIGNVIDPSNLDALTAELDRRRADFQELYCEIGSGSGAHLIDVSAQMPEALCVGFEIRFKRAFRTAEKAELRALKNLFVVRGDAQLIPRLFGPNSVNGIFVNFPDPWEKKRWQKHRIMNEAFLTELHGVLRPGGFISYRTDHGGYFQDTLNLVDRTKLFGLSKHSDDLDSSTFGQERILTEFEMLFRSKQKPIFFAEFRKD